MPSAPGMVHHRSFSLAAFSSTGEAAASTRTRLSAWVVRSGFHWDVHHYLAMNAYSAGDIASRPVAVARAEVALLRQVKSPLDVALVHREASPVSAGVQERVIRKRCRRFVFDFDDAIYAPGASALTRLRTGKVHKIIRMSDVVIAGNSTLADWASRYCEDVRVIPTCIEPADYEPASLALPTNDGPRRIVWLGSPSGEKYLRTIAGPLVAFLRGNGVRLDVISSGNASLGPLDPFVDRVEWSLAAQRRIGLYDFGIAPLDSSEFARGKSAYKLLQYAAAGLPFVASRVGANAQVAPQLGGLSAVSEAEWYEALQTLNGLSETARRKWGDSLKLKVMEDYSYSTWKPRWMDAVGLKGPLRSPEPERTEDG